MTEVSNPFLSSHVLFLWLLSHRTSSSTSSFIFISCFAHSSWILYHWLTNSSFWFPKLGSRLILNHSVLTYHGGIFLRILCVTKIESFYSWFGQDEMPVSLFLLLSFSVLTFLQWCLASFKIVVKYENCMIHGINAVSLID